MQTLNMLDNQLGSIENTIRMLNDDFCWDINVMQFQHKYFVKDRETVIFSCDSREGLDAFLYGMGLSIKGIPEPLFSQLSKAMREWCDRQ